MTFTPKKIIICGIVLVAIMAGVISLGSKHQAPAPDVQPAPVADQTLGASQNSSQSSPLTRYTTPATNSAVQCGTSNTTLLATSTSRIYAAIVNDSANTIYIALGYTAVGSNGIRLNANGGSYELDSSNMYTGIVTCIASSSSQVTVVHADI